MYFACVVETKHGPALRFTQHGVALYVLFIRRRYWIVSRVEETGLRNALAYPSRHISVILEDLCERLSKELLYGFADPENEIAMWNAQVVINNQAAELDLMLAP